VGHLSRGASLPSPHGNVERCRALFPQKKGRRPMDAGLKRTGGVLLKPRIYMWWLPFGLRLPLAGRDVRLRSQPRLLLRWLNNECPPARTSNIRWRYHGCPAKASKETSEGSRNKAPLKRWGAVAGPTTGRPEADSGWQDRRTRGRHPWASQEAWGSNRIVHLS
jgi:hypothetical protein